MNQLSAIADAVVAEIESPGIEYAEFTVERVFVPLYAETENDLKLFVVGLAETPDLTTRTRATIEHRYTIQVAILKRVDAGDRTGTEPVDELDELSDFREQVIDLLKSAKTLTAMPDAHLWDLSNPVAYEPAKLETEGVFTSVITLVYMLQR
jgi:hypothetical protein